MKTVNQSAVNDGENCAIASQTTIWCDLWSGAFTLKHRAGFIVLSGNFFDSAIMNDVSVARWRLQENLFTEPGAENSFECRAQS